MKRENYISFEEYFMGLCILSSFRSKDKKTQTGACIVDSENKIVGVGYNGLPKGLDDNNERFWKDEDDNDSVNSKHSYVIHAESNAILNSHKNLKEMKIYTKLFPCSNCAKLIIQSGIKEVIYLDKKKKASKEVDLMFEHAKIKIRRFEDKKEFIKKLNSMN